MKHTVFLVPFLFCAAVATADPVSLSVAPLAAPDIAIAPSPEVPAAVLLSLPAESGFLLTAPDPAKWVTFDRMSLSILPATNAPANLQLIAQAADWEGAWFQCLRREFLRPGETNEIDIALGPDAPGWEPLGHPGAWNRRSLLLPEMVRVILFANGVPYNGELQVLTAAAVPSEDTAPPFIRHVRPTEASTAEPPVDGRYELRFDVPDRYANPFDTDEIAVDAEIATPSGTLSVPCFYYQDCIRVPAATEERILPQGRPEWRLRFSPNEPGLHTVSLVAKDRFGETRLDNAAAFTAVPATGLRTVHVSKRDPRYFEDDGGKPFFLIGYNIRSPFDTRFDTRYPLRFRHPEGTTSYARRFHQMAANGLNIAEIWASAWCMGLEWSRTEPGYHGIGQFNMLHAWERDRVFAMAAEEGIRLNMVLNNHGRLSSFSDPEWELNPFNAVTQPGGWFQRPLEWFSEERSRVQYEKQLRYEIARYSWNANLFAWQLWSELNISCDHGDNAHRHPAVLDWHRRMATYLHTHDPKRHPVASHTSGDYNSMVPELAGLPELDHICGDAYHGSQDPLHICNLMLGTKQQGHLRERATLITEFGGTSQGAAVDHLRNEVHAALWNALPSGLAGAPMLWWWHAVEEFDFFPMYAAYSRFIAGEDFLDAHLKADPFWTNLGKLDAQGNVQPSGDVVGALASSPTLGYGWFHAAGSAYSQRPSPDDNAEPRYQGYALLRPVDVPDNTVYTFEFWDTDKGEPIRLQDVRVEHGTLRVMFPPFMRDIALKFKRKN